MRIGRIGYCHTTEGGRQASRSNTEFIKQRHGKAQGSRADLAEGDGNVSCVEEWTGSQRCCQVRSLGIAMTRPDGFAGEVSHYSDCADEVQVS